MRTINRLITIGAALFVGATTVYAQRATPADRQARREAIRQRIKTATPEQRAAFRARRVAARQERRAVAQQLRAGTITRAQARAQLRRWARHNAPTKF